MVRVEGRAEGEAEGGDGEPASMVEVLRDEAPGPSETEQGTRFGGYRMSGCSVG